MPSFQMLIISAVKTCKQCLQTASASGLLPGLRPWNTHCGTSVPQVRSLGYSPQMKISGAVAAENTVVCDTATSSDIVFSKLERRLTL